MNKRIEVKPGETFTTDDGVMLEARRVTRPWCEACWFFNAKTGRCRDEEGRYLCSGHYRDDRRFVYFAIPGTPEPDDE